MERVDVTSMNFFRSACLLTGFWRGRFGISSIFSSLSAPFSSHYELVKVLGHQLEPLSRFCNQRLTPLSSGSFSARLHKRSWGLPRWEERLITCRGLDTSLFNHWAHPESRVFARTPGSFQRPQRSPGTRREIKDFLCSVLMMQFKSETPTLCWWVTFKSTVRQRRWSTPTL